MPAGSIVLIRDDSCGFDAIFAAIGLSAVDVVDQARYEGYKTMVPSSIAAYGGRYLARGGKSQVLEGSWQPKRAVILEFPNAAQARAWWDSTEYAEAKAIRQASARTDVFILEGL